jgi:hypothetical protein
VAGVQLRGGGIHDDGLNNVRNSSLFSRAQRNRKIIETNPPTVFY